jgi:hypothetical protein
LAHYICMNRLVYGFLAGLSLGWTVLGAERTNGGFAPPPEQERQLAPGFRAGQIDRPLRYFPEDTDFIITNGEQIFNRPLYGPHTAFRVDAGDLPEFSLYLPGRGGNLRLGFRAGDQVIWLQQAHTVIARYRPGGMFYEIRDPQLGRGKLSLAVLPLRSANGLVLKAEVKEVSTPLELICAFGGVNGQKGRRGGDIGCEKEPVSRWFQLRADECSGDTISTGPNSFVVHGKAAIVSALASPQTVFAVADAADWDNPTALLQSVGHPTKTPVVLGRALLTNCVYLALQVDGREGDWSALPDLFQQAEAARSAVANRVVVATPDPFVNAAAGALNIAADALWDERQEAFMHGAVAWRQRLLGWRGPDAGDELGWHERTARHFAGFAAQQNTNPAPATLPAPEASANLSRNETALHSEGDLSRSHYDMNLVAVDAFFRHLRWTGDLEYARKWWPVIARHLAWEQRLFRREFGPDKLPLYEGYCSIWASDDLAYNGGGSTQASADLLFQFRQAAQVAGLIGVDPAPYAREAVRLERGLAENLWLADRGWYAEWKDLLGLQAVHPNAAVWTFYHALDAAVPTPQAAWQMTRFVDTQIARFPLQGPGVPSGFATLPTTSWMPYQWSLNNVVLAETMHTALGYWQANRPDGAFSLFKGALLDSMYLGQCPGNVGMCTWFDMARREAQRDFGDGCGAMSRSLIEGLFGVQPDLLAGEIKIRPGFPPDWERAGLWHPDFILNYERTGWRETYSLTNRFARPVRACFEVAARSDGVAGVTVNGQPADWRMISNSVGTPRLAITVPAAPQAVVTIEWAGQVPSAPVSGGTVAVGAELKVACGARITAVSDPQQALAEIHYASQTLQGRAVGTPGQRTVFIQAEQGQLYWWLPVMFEIQAAANVAPALDWAQPLNAPFEVVDLTRVFNDRVTEIFRHEYRSPRSPFCSLATPQQGIGSWCHPLDTFVVDDSGLRAAAAQAGNRLRLPNGVPLATPGLTNTPNITFVSQWDNFPREISVPLTGRSSHAFLLLAGSTSAMQSRFDNGEVIVAYQDGTTARLALRNPTTWWPIDQDYYIDDFAFARPEPLPPRVDLRTGAVRILQLNEFKGKGREVPGGAATVLELPLDASRELKSLTLRALANEVVIGLMSVTLQR